MVIGSRPAGQRAAVQAAKLGKRTVLVERRKVLGGVCVNTGTIPSKTLREAVLYLTGHGQHGIYGSSYAVKEHTTIDDLMTRCSFVIKREIDVTRAQMRRNEVEMILGEASFKDAHSVIVADGTGQFLFRGPYPTLAECYKVAALDCANKLQKQKLS